MITGEFFQRMPLYQRHSRAVLYLTPGVNASGLAYAGALGGFSINGGATSNIGYFEDGMYGVQPSGTNTTDTILSTIEEAKVMTTVLPAEYGHSAGGAIVIVKKSGTNQLHGGGGTSVPRRPMQHRRFMQPARFEQTGNSLHFYQPDFNIGGPVCIPKVYNGRNRTFFMFAGQYLMERQGEQITLERAHRGRVERRFQLWRTGRSQRRSTTRARPLSTTASGADRHSREHHPEIAVGPRRHQISGQQGL